MKLNVINIKGDIVRSIEVSDSIFSVDVNDQVLHTAVKGYLANQRQGTHATKTKALVSGGGKKPFKQKGTGEARQGSKRSPLMPGGGTAHGPQPRDYTEKVNVKVRRLALKMAMSDKVKHQKLFVVDSLSFDKYSTKQIINFLNVAKIGESALIANHEVNPFLVKSTDNLPKAFAVKALDIHAHHVLRSEALILSEEAINQLQTRLEKGSK